MGQDEGSYEFLSDWACFGVNLLTGGQNGEFDETYDENSIKCEGSVDTKSVMNDPSWEVIMNHGRMSLGSLRNGKGCSEDCILTVS